MADIIMMDYSIFLSVKIRALGGEKRHNELFIKKATYFSEESEQLWRGRISASPACGIFRLRQRREISTCISCLIQSNFSG